MSEIIAAFATPPGASGLQVLRVSGEGSARLVDRIFTFGPLPRGEAHVEAPALVKKRTVEEMAGYQAAFGYVHELDAPAKAIDQCVLTRFRRPHSYTGDEQVELSIHGGPALRRLLMELVLQAGCRPAEAGEFSKRAFLNGKMDLAQAESVMAMIQADTARQQKAAVRQLQGNTGHFLAEIRDLSYQLLAALEVAIEYPEYDDFTGNDEGAAESLRQIRQKLEELAARNRQGRILREGMQVVLLGEPNVGKSSLLNALAGEERAIVTEVAGTTRDSIELALDMAGIPLTIVDTAGIRESEDLVEQIGVDRSKKRRDEADLLMLVVTAEKPAEITAKVELLIGENETPFLLLCNKIDLADGFTDSSEWQETLQTLEAKYERLLRTILISATKSWGLDELRETIAGYFESLGNSSGTDLVLTSARQQRLLEEALEVFRDLERDFGGLPSDIVATGIRQGLEILGEITGEDVSEQMVEEIFSRFCIGK